MAMDDIPEDEERLLGRVKASLAARVAPGTRRDPRYDQELMALRDEAGEARLEDVPALIAQMERLEGVSMKRAEGQGMLVDPGAPYFGHLRLKERPAGGGRQGVQKEVERDVLIGRATFVDPERRVNIVDWRHAPVSELYYRYGEGSDYEERFGDREVEGDILVRRTLTIEGGELGRIAAPQGIFVRGADGRWLVSAPVDHELAGGEGTAVRPAAPAPVGARGVLGAGADAGAGRAQRLDRHLPEIAALIDPRQFELITSRQSQVVVIQGGAGSGKTTIGLHRMAYLAYAAPGRFDPHRMLVCTHGSALAAYISQVLPALGVPGVPVMTFGAWAERELRRAIPWLKARIVEEGPAAVLRVKSHPALLAEIERRARQGRAAGSKRVSRAVVDLWAELVTDLPRLRALLTAPAPTDAAAAAAADGDTRLPDSDVVECHRFMIERVASVMESDPRTREPAAKPERRRKTAADRRKEAAYEALASAERPVEAAKRDDTGRDDDLDPDADVRGETGIDGMATVGADAELDLPDVALLLRANQLLRGAKHGLCHLFVDEAQDLSPLELSVLIEGTTADRSITLAGDTAQRLYLDNGFRDWRTVLQQLGLGHVAVEPLRIAYRSTRQILELASHAMGKLAGPPPHAPRSGAPVEAHRFPGAGAAVGFLAEALRPLFSREPRATVAVLARHPEQADRYYAGLRRAEVPSLRRVRAQDFSFRPGVEVTEIRQVKGLEFDYVVLVDVNASSFGTDDESRHLLHIGATRAAHQLWLVVTGTPSPLIPAALLAA
jgi:DNA helicase II / ATP-dependent DNA helicase PcrA